MEDFKRIIKMKAGGSVSKAIAAYEKRERKTEEKADVAQDKQIVKKAIRMHDAQEHKGEKTDLSKLKKGGRSKKAVGTVKKYSGEDGSYVTKAVDAVKSFGTDIKNNILGTPEQNKKAQESLDKQAAKGSKLAKFFGGKAEPVEKCSGGRMKSGGKTCQ